MQAVYQLVINAPIIFIVIFACLAAFFVYTIVRFLEKQWKSRKEMPAERIEHALERHENNPVLAPLPHKDWEAVGTFNPAAVKDDEGSVHLLYRAIGKDGLSRVGHAKSKDGLKFDHRSSYPVYISKLSRKTNSDPTDRPKTYNPVIYTSGGGWGGCEDPRAVVIDGRLYMSYTAFEGWDSVCIGITSISMEDLKHSRWNWMEPMFASAPGEVNKNWVLFPEKINGKFAVLHSISPEIQVDFIDEINSKNTKYIKSVPPSGGRPDHWDNWVRGAGPPPVKTSLGWLLLYHAMDKKDPNKYKLGCMILDLKDPTKVLYRSNGPVLEPNMPYENDWKPGVVYASGALIIGKDLVVYYGGGDKYVCVAQTPLKQLLDWMVEHGKVGPGAEQEVEQEAEPKEE